MGTTMRTTKNDSRTTKKRFDRLPQDNDEDNDQDNDEDYDEDYEKRFEDYEKRFEDNEKTI